jgi:hypothetical protein
MPKRTVTKRPPIPAEAQKAVLVRSRRRCCLCFGLEFDASYKDIQIAHVDHNRNNNKEDNLAALCLVHHNVYDSKPSQSKGFTAQELRHHREQLYATLDQRHTELVLTQPLLSREWGDGAEPRDDVTTDDTQKVTPSAHLLGQVLAAYDREFEGIQRGRRANGLALAHLGKTAVEVFGDFDVAAEAFISLVRLASVSGPSGEDVIGRLRTVGIHATRLTAAVDLLKYFSGIDTLLINSVARKSAKYALHGNASFDDINLGLIPHESFHVMTAIFCEACKDYTDQKIEWASSWLIAEVTRVLVASAFSLKIRNIPLPIPTDLLYARWSVRDIPDDQPVETLPLVQCCNRLAYLPQPFYDYAVSHTKFTFACFPRVDEAKGKEWDEVNEKLPLIAATGGGALCLIPVKKEEDVDKCKVYAEELTDLGQKAATQIREFLQSERQILMRTPQEKEEAKARFMAAYEAGKIPEGRKNQD